MVSEVILVGPLELVIPKPANGEFPGALGAPVVFFALVSLVLAGDDAGLDALAGAGDAAAGRCSAPPALLAAPAVEAGCSAASWAIARDISAAAAKSAMP